MKDGLLKFIETGDLVTYCKSFFCKLRDHLDTKYERVWFIIDEVVLFEQHEIHLPSLQDVGSFHWILTGSAGMGSWVGKRHLKKYVYELPLFTKKEYFARKLAQRLNFDIREGIEHIPYKGLADMLEESFGGIIGYVTEFMFEVSGGELMVNFMSQVKKRITKVLKNVPYADVLTFYRMCLKDLTKVEKDMVYLPDTGLCGLHFPKGVILTFLIELLHELLSNNNELEFIKNIRTRFASDPTMNGCLLEREEILLLMRGKTMHATERTYDLRNRKWINVSDLVLPGVYGSCYTLLEYNNIEITPAANNQFTNINTADKPKWYLILVPKNFCVIDVAIMDISNVHEPILYGIQITCSDDPFKNHRTYETCPDKSKGILKIFWNAVIDYINKNIKTKDKRPLNLTENQLIKKFVMRCPLTTDEAVSAPRKSGTHLISRETRW